MLVTTHQMRAIEDHAFSRGVTAEALMDLAGLAIADVVSQFFPQPAHARVFCGKGNNAGDVLVTALHLIERGWTVDLDESYPDNDLSELPARHLAALRPRCSQGLRPTIALDGLLGIGVKGAPRDPIASAITRLETLREESHVFVFSADLPSGLDANTGQPGDPCVTADVTVTIGQCKIGLVADNATNHVGRLALAQLPDLASAPRSADPDPADLLVPRVLAPLLPLHDFDSHKGKWGRVGIIAGARGTLGAARLCSESAVRAGGGLVTLYVKPDAFELFATSCVPEVMVKAVDDYRSALDDPLDALAIGPGLGDQSDEEVLEILRRIAVPTVADADALNTIARHRSPFPNHSSPLLLTPHPGEFSRLAPGLANLSRAEAAQRFTDERGVTLLLKGARTIIAEHRQPLRINTTGNPGMGTGGMGDVLTGVLAAFLAQGCSARDAASLGAWLCGRAAERYVFGPTGSPETLVASEVIRHLGPALRDLRSEKF